MRNAVNFATLWKKKSFFAKLFLMDVFIFNYRITLSKTYFMKRKTLSVLVLSILLVVACSKQGTEKPIDADQKQPAFSARSNENGGCGDPSNSSNPWDSVGVYHNYALEDVKKHALGGTADLKQYLNYSNNYMVSTFSSRVPNIRELLPSEDQITSILADSASYYSNFIDKSSYSEGVKGKFKELIGIITDDIGYEDADYCDIKVRILEFEEKLLADGSLKTEEKDQVLKASSVARYSLYFWYNEYQASLETSKRKWWQWLVVGVADVAGGIAGGIATGATVVGAVAGAVAGAAGASSGAAAVLEYFEK